MNRLASSVALLSTAFVAPLALAGDALTIREIAPDKALLVLGADDVRGTMARLDTTAYGKLSAEPAFAEEYKKLMEKVEVNLKEAAQRAGIERESITWPASLGLAVMAEIDPELGVPDAHFMFFCDWASQAEATVKMVDAIVAEMEKDAKDASEKIKVEEVRGRRAIGLPMGEGNDAAAEKGGAEDGMEEEEAGPSIGPKELFVVSDKGRLLMASSVAALDTLLARVDGDRTKPMGESETFRAATELSGGTQDVYAVLSTEAAGPMLGTMPQFMLVRPLISRFFGDIKAWSFGLNMKDGVIEVGQGICVPGGKVGLLALADLATEPKAPPAIVPNDAISYGRLNLRFDKIVATLDDAIAGLPEEQGEMIKPQLDLYRPAMQAAFAALGPEVHIWGFEQKLEDPNSGATVTAIAMKNDKDSARAVSDFISLLPLGLQSRDFNGMTILSDEFSPFALGIGGGYLVIGPTDKVEQTLRSVDAKGETGLAADAQFAQGMAKFSKSPLVGMAWWNTAKELEAQARMVAGLAARVEGMTGIEADEAEMPGLGIESTDILKMFEKLKPDLIKRCFSDTTLEFSAKSTGFSTTYRLHPAAAK